MSGTYQLSRNNIFFLIIKVTLIFNLFGFCYSQNSKIEALYDLNNYIKFIETKNIGIVSNQSSVFFKRDKKTHLVDSLLNLGLSIKAIFGPEHGFRGDLDAGEKINDSIDERTGIPIISLYGKKKKPSAEDLKGIDIMLFDLQDVGVRFYTYLSTLHYIMESCAENDIKLIVLDRPNPNANIIDGPIMESSSMSFVGLHPVPILYGMTIGEYARMINDEGWTIKKADLKVIPMADFKREMVLPLKIKPSPNLPNLKSINLYASLCFFEQTPVSVGRGTNMQFQVVGSPNWNNLDFKFIPEPNIGAKNPKHNGKTCYGFDLRKSNFLNSINLEWLIYAYNNSNDKENFFRSGFHRLAGTKNLEHQIKNGISVKKIKETWKDDIIKFKKIREKYLIYN